VDILAARLFYISDIQVGYIHAPQFLLIRNDEFQQILQSIVVGSMKLWLFNRLFPGKVAIVSSSIVPTNRAPVFFRPVYILSCYVSGENN
jgi:hypothetical protein